MFQQIRLEPFLTIQSAEDNGVNYIRAEVTRKLGGMLIDATKDVQTFFSVPRFMRVQIVLAYEGSVPSLVQFPDVFVGVASHLHPTELKISAGDAALAVYSAGVLQMADSYNDANPLLDGQAMPYENLDTPEFLLKFDPLHVDSDKAFTIMSVQGEASELELPVFTALQVAPVIGIRGVTGIASTVAISVDYLNAGTFDVGTAIGWGA